MGSLLGFVIVLLIAVAVGYAAVTWGLLWMFGRTLPVDEVHHVDVGGGWQAALHRLRPSRSAGDAPRRPVILAHGIAMCSRFWHMTPETSFARYLAHRGHDVWIVEYRGVGASQHRGNQPAWDYCLDQYIFEDAPALIGYVRRLTGARRVNWVGHSMGGMILYGYAQAHGTDHLGRVVTVGTPCKLGKGANHLRIPGWIVPFALRGVRFPLYRFVRWTMPFSVYLKNWFLPTFYSVRETSTADIAALFSRGVMDLSCKLLRQFHGWQRSGDMLLEDGESRIEEAPATLDRPLLVVAGAADRLVPPHTALPAYERCPSPEKARRVFGGEGDAAPRLGHNDLIASANGARWVQPVIARWLERVDEDDDLYEDEDDDPEEAGDEDEGSLDGEE